MAAPIVLDKPAAVEGPDSTSACEFHCSWPRPGVPSIGRGALHSLPVHVGAPDLTQNTSTGMKESGRREWLAAGASYKYFGGPAHIL